MPQPNKTARAGRLRLPSGWWRPLGVQDITQLGKVYSSGTFKFFETYNVVAFLYLIMTISLSLLVRLLEERMRRPDHN